MLIKIKRSKDEACETINTEIISLFKDTIEGVVDRIFDLCSINKDDKYLISITYDTRPTKIGSHSIRFSFHIDDLDNTEGEGLISIDISDNSVSNFNYTKAVKSYQEILYTPYYSPVSQKDLDTYTYTTAIPDDDKTSIAVEENTLKFKSEKYIDDVIRNLYGTSKFGKEPDNEDN